LRTGLRVFVSLWYLLGWLSHVYLGLFGPEHYRRLGETALIPGYTSFWNTIVMPHITVFALLLAGFEILVGGLLVSKGNWVKAGLILSIMFNVFLVQMGLGIHRSDPLVSFLFNRLPNLIFIFIQVPLLWGGDKLTILERIRNRKSL